MPAPRARYGPNGLNLSYRRTTPGRRIGDGFFALLLLGGAVWYCWAHRYQYRIAPDGVRERVNLFTREVCTEVRGTKVQWDCGHP